MIKNYFKIAWRNISKNKIFSAINVFGLSIGLACCILMFMFIQHELSYDKFHTKTKNIYRITSEEQGAAEKKLLAITPAPWAPLIKKDYPEVKEYVRVLKDEKVLVGEKGKEHSFLKTVLLVDSSFFDVFSFKLLNGNLETALTRPNSIVLTKDAAKKYFGDTDPVGKTIEAALGFTGTIDVQVTGVIEEPPANSHIKFNALMSMSTLGDLSNTWS